MRRGILIAAAVGATASAMALGHHGLVPLALGFAWAVCVMLFLWAQEAERNG